MGKYRTMRTFIDVRFYLDATVDPPPSAESVAAALASKHADAETFRVSTHRMLGFGAEGADGEVVTWNSRDGRAHP